MDQASRAQVRLILEHAIDLARKRTNEKVAALLAANSAKGLLHSGGTIKGGARLLEDEASQYIANWVDQVIPVSKDPEAFALIHEAVTRFLMHLDAAFEKIVDTVMPRISLSPSMDRGAEALISNAKMRLTRQLELHRFTFTRPFPAVASIVSASSPITPQVPPRNAGGKPLAKHWDQVWAAVAVQLFVGDLKPNSQADIEKAMLDWFAKKDIDIGQTSVRERARVLWQALKAAE